MMIPASLRATNKGQVDIKPIIWIRPGVQTQRFELCFRAIAPISVMLKALEAGSPDFLTQRTPRNFVVG